MHLSPEVDDASLLSFHSIPRQEAVATPTGPLRVDLINPGVNYGAFLPDGDEYYQEPVQNLAIQGIGRYLSATGRGPRDILHAHHWTSALAIRLANEAGMTTIFTPDMLGPLNLRVGRSCSGLRFAVERNAMLDARYVTVNTNRERDTVSVLYSNTPEEQEQLLDKIVVMPPGINTHTFNPERATARRLEARAKLGIPHEANFVAITAGRLSVAKNFESAIEGWRIFAQQNTDPGQYLVIVTNTSNDDDPYLRALLSRIDTLPANVKDSILLRDFQSDPMNIYAAADVFVSASRLETYGSTLSEAMSSGNPVAASGIYEYREQLGLTTGHGYTSPTEKLIVPLDDDPEVMGVGLARVLEHIKEQVSDAGRGIELREMMHQLGSRHSWERTARKLIELSQTK